MQRYLLVLILLVILVSPTHGQIHQVFQPDPAETERAACTAEMDKILKAVVRSNLSHSNHMAKVREEDLAEDGFLRRSGYLTASLVKPTSRCFYSSEGDLVSSGTIRCSIHGLPWLHTPTSEFQAFVKKLDLALLAGADINARNASGQTVIHLAVAKGDAPLLKYLAAKGARPDLPDSSGKTPFDLACDKGNVEIIDILCGLLPGLSRPSWLSTLGMPSLPTRPAPRSLSAEAGVFFWNGAKKALENGKDHQNTLKRFLGSPLFTASGIPAGKQKKIKDLQASFSMEIQRLEEDLQGYWSGKLPTPELCSRAQEHLWDADAAKNGLIAAVEASIALGPNQGRLPSVYLEVLLESLSEETTLPANLEEQLREFLVFSGSAHEMKTAIAARLETIPGLIARQRSLLRLGSLFSGSESGMNLAPSNLEELEEFVQQGEAIQQRLRMMNDRLSQQATLTSEELNELNARRGLLNQEGVRMDFRLSRVLEKLIVSLGIPDRQEGARLLSRIYGGKYQEAAEIIRKQATLTKSGK